MHPRRTKSRVPARGEVRSRGWGVDSWEPDVGAQRAEEVEEDEDHLELSRVYGSYAAWSACR
jgi:hypothetical protein